MTILLTAGAAASAVEDVDVTAAPRPPAILAEIDLQLGLQRLPYDRLALPIDSYLSFEATSPRRNSGAFALLGLDLDPLGPEGGGTVLALEAYHRGAGDRLDVRLGRLNVVRGGRFRYLDGADVGIELADHLQLALWGGAAWHPEQVLPFQAGPTWGLDLSYRSGAPLGGAVRYDHVHAEDGRWVDRLGGDASLHLPRASGLVVEARVDVVPAWSLVELASLAGELRPHHRLHLRAEAGVRNPRADSWAEAGSVYALFFDGPTFYADARARAGLPRGVLTIDVGGIAVHDGDEAAPGIRGAVGVQSHPGRAWRYAVHGSALAGPGGEAFMVLAEVGRGFGPIQLALLGEQAVYRLQGRPWRAVSHLGARAGVDAGLPLHLSLTGQLELGRNGSPEGQLLLFATFRLAHGRRAGPRQQRDRYLSPWSPHGWERAEMPRSPGTAPGADPYPSIPQGVEDDS